MIYRRVLLIAFAALALAGCKMVEPFFSRPTVSFERGAVQDMSLFDATLLFTFSVHNPNPVGINIQKGIYDFAIEGASMASGTVEEQIRVGPGGTGFVFLPVHVNFMDFFDSVAAIALRDEVAYKLSGSFDVMGFTIPYKTEGKLALPDFPEISVETVNVRSLGISGAKVNVILSLNNPNSFAVGLHQIKYSLDIGGLQFLSGVTENIKELDENERFRINVPLDIDFVSLGRSALHLLDGKSAPYRLSGEMRFNVPGTGWRELPFSKAGEVNLRR